MWLTHPPPIGHVLSLPQVNSQLMEAIQQKVELSQQLDQWQQDMQELLEEQMNRKMVGISLHLKPLEPIPVAETAAEGEEPGRRSRQ